MKQFFFAYRNEGLQTQCSSKEVAFYDALAHLYVDICKAMAKFREYGVIGSVCQASVNFWLYVVEDIQCDIS